MPEQIGLIVLLALFALFQFAVRALRARRTRPRPEDGRDEGDAIPAPPPPPLAVRDAVPRGPAARPGAVPSARRPGVGRPAPARRRPRFGARELRRAIVLAAVLAPPRGLEPPPSGEIGAR
jgi:hypothetical protein